MRQHIRTLTTAATVALAILGSTGGLVHAERNGFSEALLCRLNGHVWDDRYGCNDHKCVFGSERHGHFDTIRVLGQTWLCNGFTGQWIIIGARAPGGRVVPSTLGTLEPINTAPAGLTAPQPTRNSR